MKNQGLKQIFLAFMVGLAAMLCLPMASAQSGLLKADFATSYTVAEGDTLWNIAGQFLQDPERWTEIWKPDEYLDEPELIYPGDVLLLSLLGGSPRILVQRGDRTVTRIGPQMRAETLKSAIPAIPLEAIENSFTRNRIVNRELYDAAPYIVANSSDNLALGTGDEIYARGVWPEGTSSFEIYRAGRAYTDATGKTELGLELEYLGFASIISTEAQEMRRMLINNSSKEIRVGDRLLIREQSRLNATLFPTAPSSHVEGQIVAIVGAERMASQLDTVVINLGLNDNLVIGDVLSIQQPGGSLVDDVERGRMSLKQRVRTVFNREQLQLPSKEVGQLLVYKIFDQLSYAVILSSTAPAEIFYPVVSPPN